LRAAASGVEPAAADTPLLSVKDNPAAPKIGMALLRGEAEIVEESRAAEC